MKKDQHLTFIRMVQIFSLFCLLAVQGNATLTTTAVSSSASPAMTGTFVFTANSSYGPQFLGSMILLFSSTASNPASRLGSDCAIRYDKTTGVVDMDGYFSGPNSYGFIGTPKLVTSPPCNFNTTSALVSISGNQVNFQVMPTFTTSLGMKYLWAYLNGTSGESASGWQMVGTWTVGAASAIPTVSLVSPASGGTGNPQQFQFAATDPAGVGDISYTWGSIQPSPGWPTNSCTVLCYASSVYLLSSDGSSWGSPLTAGGAGTLSNPQCDVPAATVSITSIGNTLYCSFTPTFKAGFSGNRSIVGLSSNNAGQYNGPNNLGNWTIPSGGIVPPDQVLAITRESAPAPEPVDLPAMISLTQANYNPSDPGALSVYHVNDPINFRIWGARPFSQVWVQRRSFQNDGVPVMPFTQTVCSHSTGQESEGLEDSINGACLLGSTDASGFFQWNGNIYAGGDGLHYLGLTTVKFYVGPQVLNPIRPGITNGPMNEDNSIGGLVYWVLDANNLPTPPVW